MRGDVERFGQKSDGNPSADSSGGCFLSPVVGVILGSKSDLPLMESCVKVLDELGLEHEVKVCSAHRNPRGVMEWASSARERGLKVVIAAAGGAAHLPGVVAAWTDLPVIGVPVPTPHLGGVDSLYSIVQMPAGIPVATVAIGEAGAKNAAWLAARIIGLDDQAVERRHAEKRAALAGPA
jgi:5-(carboxyamino)imidazole ribonucleotide mutase